MLELDGEDDIIDFGRLLDIETDHRRISFRFKGGTSTGTLPLLTNGQNLSQGQQHAIYLEDGYLTLQWQRTGAARSIQSANPIANLNQWHDVEVVIDRAGLASLYLDGVLQGETALGISEGTDWTKPTSVPASFQIGGTALNAGGSSTTFWLDDLHICDEGISAQTSGGSSGGSGTGEDDPFHLPLGTAPRFDFPPVDQVAGKRFVYNFSATLEDPDSSFTETVPFTLVGAPYARLPDGTLLTITDMELRNHFSGSQLIWRSSDQFAQFAGASVHLMLRAEGCGEGAGTEVPLTLTIASNAQSNRAPQILSDPEGASGR